MLIKVTEKHIAEARELIRCPKSGTYIPRCDCCPVALAVRERTGKDWSIYGTLALMSEGDTGLAHDARKRRLSLRTQRWIRRFDANLTVKPFALRF